MLQVSCRVGLAIRRFRRRATRATIFLLVVSVKACPLDCLAYACHLASRLNPGLRPVFVKNRPLLVAMLAIMEPLASEELEIIAKVFNRSRVI